MSQEIVVGFRIMRPRHEKNIAITRRVSLGLNVLSRHISRIQAPDMSCISYGISDPVTLVGAITDFADYPDRTSANKRRIYP